MPLVVGGVLDAVVGVQLIEALDDRRQLGRGRQVDDQRRHLGPQEVVGAGRAERREARHLGPRQEVQHDVLVVVVAHHRRVGGGDAAQDRCQLGGAAGTGGLRQRLPPVDLGAERLRAAVLGDERLGAADHVEAATLALLARVAPRGQSVAAEHAADRLRVRRLQLGHVEAELEAGPAPVDPQHLVAEALPGQLRAVDGRRQRDDRVGVQVVDVLAADERVHGRVDAGRRAAAAEQAVVEQRHHLVLVLDAAVDADEALDAAQVERREARLGERAEVAAGSLDVHHARGVAGGGIERVDLGGGVAARVVGVPAVAAEPVAAVEQLGDRPGGTDVGGAHEPHPDAPFKPRCAVMPSA